MPLWLTIGNFTPDLGQINPVVSDLGKTVNFIYSHYKHYIWRKLTHFHLEQALLCFSVVFVEAKNLGPNVYPYRETKTIILTGISSINMFNSAQMSFNKDG